MTAPNLKASMPVRARVFGDGTPGEPGDVEPYIDEEGRLWALGICCPGCGSGSLLRLGAVASGPSWQTVAGDPRTGEGLTLSPSVHHTTGLGGCGWHGWVRGGRWVPC